MDNDILDNHGNQDNNNTNTNALSNVDKLLNQDIIDVINTLAKENISNLTNKYRDNKYILTKINNYITNLPVYLENDYSNYIRKRERLDKVTELSKEFIDTYINNNNYYYCTSSEIFFKYDGINYFTYRDDTILYEIGNLLNRDDVLVNYKHRIKNSIVKEIKERNILDSIPDTSTIQLVINNILPLFLNNKTYVKYFLTVIGDIILKKNEDFTYLIDNNYKRFIKTLSELAYQYFGSNHFTSIKYGYHENQKNCRIIYADKNILANRYNNTIENLVSNLNCKNNNNFLDLFIVGVYYSNRYENGDRFLSSHDCEAETRASIMLIDDIHSIIDKFIGVSIERSPSAIDETDNIKITSKNMQYLWKLFLTDNNLPNINFVNSLKMVLRSKIDYSQEQDTYLGITSKKLPFISNFLEFWNTTIKYSSKCIQEDEKINELIEDTNLEISEIVILFKQWLHENAKNVSNVSITENSIIDLITYYYEGVQIEEDKYILNIQSLMWDKNNSIIDFIRYYKVEYIDSQKIKRNTINTNNLYTTYCKWCKETGIKFVVGKHYFQKFIINYLDGYVKDNFIDTKYFLSI